MRHRREMDEVNTGDGSKGDNSNLIKDALDSNGNLDIQEHCKLWTVASCFFTLAASSRPISIAGQYLA